MFSQLTRDRIISELDDNFTSAIKKRGYNYYNAGKVTVTVEGEDYISAEVEGSGDMIYDVDLYTSEYSSDIEVICDCPYNDPCKHEAALLYYLLNKMDTPSLDIKHPVKLVHQDASIYRKMDIVANSLYHTINAYEPRGGATRPPWYMSSYGVIRDDHTLELKSATDNNYSYRRDPESSISIQWRVDGMYIKCNTCNKKSDRFCEHQSILIQLMCSALDGLDVLSADFSFSNVLTQAAKAKGIDVDVFHKYHQLTLLRRGTYDIRPNPNVKGRNWISKFNETLAKRSARITQGRGDTLRDDGRQAKYGFVWIWEDVEIPTVKFINGYAYKTKEGIHNTDRMISDAAEYMPTNVRPIATDILALQFESNAKEQLRKATDLISANFECLNSVYQYALKEGGNEHRLPHKDLLPFQFTDVQIHCSFSVILEDRQYYVTRHLKINDVDIDVKDDIKYSNLFFSIFKDKAYLHPHVDYSFIMSMFEEHETIILEGTRKKPVIDFIHQLQKNFEVHVEKNILPREKTLLHPKYSIYLTEQSGHILFEPKITYLEHNVTFNAFEHNPYHYSTYIYRPDPSDVEYIVNYVKQAHEKFANQDTSTGYVYLEFSSLLNDYWMMSFVEGCKVSGIEVYGQENLKEYNYSNHRAVISTHVKSGIDWFDISTSVTFGDEQVPLVNWIKALKQGNTFVKLKDGTFGVLPEEWVQRMSKVLKVAEVHDGEVALSKYQFNIIDQLFEEQDLTDISAELQERKQKLVDYDFDLTYDVSRDIKATLRDYQYHGYQWLKFLEANELGGILADDMGLGKTLQVICLLADQRGMGLSLVIVPRTLLYNWSSEIDKFCPKLNYQVHHGPMRSRDMEEYQDQDLIITTYGTAASDIEMLRERSFHYVILDESQAIKNPNSQRNKAIRLLQAKHRLAMTGTPIENNTMDLFAQFSFVCPGLLGGPSRFRNNFAVPIDNHGDQDAAQMLKGLIQPFVLRRTKEQVAKELPERSESIMYCEMPTTQRRMYDQLKEKVRQDVHAAVKDKGVAKSKFTMLDGLLRLRQMCNSPVLINKTISGKNAESVKIQTLIKCLEECTLDHSALVFSQFVQLLTLVRRELDRKGIKYAYLDGSTTNRKKVVQEFLEDEEIKVFLISIKAGNTGMNLTKADYVYILDPWWNPAVEAQAIDRTHRIGQEKQVFAYKMICKDTIEEKILKLQSKKKKLAEDIIQVDEHILKSLNKQDLLGLFD